MGDILKIGLIGGNIQNSRMPAGQKLMCEAHGLELEFDLIDSDLISDFDFHSTVANCRSAEFRGVSVTHPFKVDAADMLPEGTLPLRASNLLLFNGDGLDGTNTDLTGFMSAWSEQMGQQKPGCVAMAGAGGVAQALAHALMTLGAEDLAIWDVDETRAEALAKSVGGTARAIAVKDVGQAINAADGLVNATPLGMFGHEGSAFDLPLVSSPNWAFDAVYTPTDTEFLLAAADTGATIITGFDLFRHMAVLTFEAFGGLSVDKPAMLEKLATLRPT